MVTHSKKIYDDEAKRAQSRANEEKKVFFTNDYNKRKGPDLDHKKIISPRQDRTSLIIREITNSLT